MCGERAGARALAGNLTANPLPSQGRGATAQDIARDPRRSVPLSPRGEATGVRTPDFHYFGGSSSSAAMSWEWL
jgi:hypothetical protein